MARFMIFLFCFRVDYFPIEGRYDLVITGADSDRDHAQFECKVKEEGSGRVLHSAVYTLTVLVQPGAPQISPQNINAVEGREFQITCSSVGGAPDPQIR